MLKIAPGIEDAVGEPAREARGSSIWAKAAREESGHWAPPPLDVKGTFFNSSTITDLTVQPHVLRKH